jgi:hypothetical protein
MDSPDRAVTLRRRQEEIRERIDELREREQQLTDRLPRGSSREEAAQANAYAQQAHGQAGQAHRRAAEGHEDAAEVHQHALMCSTNTYVRSGLGLTVRLLSTTGMLFSGAVFQALRALDAQVNPARPAAVTASAG